MTAYLTLKHEEAVKAMTKSVEKVGTIAENVNRLSNTFEKRNDEIKGLKEGIDELEDYAYRMSHLKRI